MNSTVLIAVSSSLTAVSAIAGILFEGNLYLKYGAIGVVVISTLITVFQAVLNERDTSFTKRALTNLIRSVRPSDYIRAAIFGAVKKEAGKLGMPYMHTAGFESGKYILQFGSDGHHNRVGVLCLKPEKISELSIYDTKNLQIEVHNLCASHKGKNISDCWNELKEEITLVSELTFAYHLQKVSTVKLWEDAERKYLAVGPPDCPDDTPTHERAEFPHSVLQDLISLNALQRGARIAESVERLIAC